MSGNPYDNKDNWDLLFLKKVKIFYEYKTLNSCFYSVFSYFLDKLNKNTAFLIMSSFLVFSIIYILKRDILYSIE